MKQLWSQTKKWSPVLWWGSALGMAVSFFAAPEHGYDWFIYFYPSTHHVPSSGYFNPLWIYPLLAPLAVLPEQISFAALTLISLICTWYACRWAGGSRWGALFSFPMVWVLWNGQLDALLVLGVALGVFLLENPARFGEKVWLRDLLLGFSLYLLMLKPHVGAPLALLYFIWSRSWRVLLLPAAAVLLSVALWGWDWIPHWLGNLVVQRLNFTTQVTNLSLFPWGLPVLGVVYLPLTRTQKAAALLAATFLASPYAPAYSLLMMFAFPLPWWAYIPASLPLILGPAWFKLALLTPLLYVGFLVLQVYRTNRQKTVSLAAVSK